MNDIKTIVRRPKAPKQITSATPSSTAFSLNTTNPEALKLGTDGNLLLKIVKNFREFLLFRG